MFPPGVGVFFFAKKDPPGVNSKVEGYNPPGLLKKFLCPFRPNLGGRGGDSEDITVVLMD